MKNYNINKKVLEEQQNIELLLYSILQLYKYEIFDNSECKLYMEKLNKTYLEKGVKFEIPYFFYEMFEV